MTTLEKVKAARELISDPSRWTQMYEARDVGGNGVTFRDPSAVSFCAAAALWKCGCETAVMYEIHHELDSVVKFNDSHTHEEVLALFDKTICLLGVAPMRPTYVYVYVAGPLSGQKADNTRKAVLAGESLLQMGYTPFIPHLMMFWEAITGSREWEDWLDYDENRLRRCNVVLRLPGESRGADREVEYARQYGIPVVYSINELTARFPL